MAMPSSSPLKVCSTAKAIDAAALPAAATKVRPLGGLGRCGARIFRGSAAATAARKLSSRSSRIRRREGFLLRVGAEVVVRGIGLAEHAADLVDRDVGKAAAVVHVFHV